MGTLSFWWSHWSRSSRWHLPCRSGVSEILSLVCFITCMQLINLLASMTGKNLISLTFASSGRRLALADWSSNECLLVTFVSIRQPVSSILILHDLYSMFTLLIFPKWRCTFHTSWTRMDSFVQRLALRNLYIFWLVLSW